MSQPLVWEGCTIWIADAHRDGQRFVARADEKLTAFLELESAIRAAERSENCGGHEIKLAKLFANHVKASLITSPDVSTHFWPS